jgi:anti-sigma factor RsiW
MTREFPDELHNSELISAFLDDELSPAERAQVEHHLAASPADRQLLLELKTLRGEVAGLPAPRLRPDFADRVVQAVIAEAEKNNGARGVVSRAPPVEERHYWRRWKFEAAAASAVALAACVLLAMLVGRQRNAIEPKGLIDPNGAVAVMPPEVPGVSNPATTAAALAALPEQLVAAMAAGAPSDREVVVLRLRASKDVPVAEALESAMAAAGLKTPVGSGAASAALLEEAYQKSWEGKLGDASVAAAEAVFIETPYERLCGVVDQLAAKVKDPLRLEAAGKLTLGPAWDENRAEGESAAAPIVQHLNASLFKLQKTVVDAAQAVTGSQAAVTIDPRQRVRVLILVEPAE